jgi:hypothetical protein
MADENYEIDIEAGHDDEMQVEDDGTRQRGRGFAGGGGGGGGDSQMSFGNANNAGSQAPATAVRCMFPHQKSQISG